MRISQEELDVILRKHKMWLNDEKSGEIANLNWVNLRRVNLWGVNLQGAHLWRTNLEGACLEGANLQDADLQLSNLKGANLRGANLLRTNLNGADLRGADLDFSVFPLWCGSFDMKVDEKFIIQLAYHFCKLDCDSKMYQELRNKMLDTANQFHRINKECDELEKSELKVEE
jgi:uncharacterized protein YjbI with pentapeptide repeats